MFEDGTITNEQLNRVFFQITKEDVDSFETRQEIPSCQLTAVWTTPNKPSQLIHEIPLEGTKKPSFFSIILDCDYTPQRSTESIRGELTWVPTGIGILILHIYKRKLKALLCEIYDAIPHSCVHLYKL